jgi:hypothetical protein
VISPLQSQYRKKRESDIGLWGKYTHLHISGFIANEHRRNLQRFKTRLLTPYQTIPRGKDPLDVKLSQLFLEAVG